MHPVVLYGRHLQTSRPVHQTPLPHDSNITSHDVCLLSYVGLSLLPQGSLAKPEGSKTPCIHQFGIGAGFTVVDGGRQLVSGKTFCVTTSHCHCHHRCQYELRATWLMLMNLNQTLFSQVIRIESDNTTTVAYISKERGVHSGSLSQTTGYANGDPAPGSLSQRHADYLSRHMADPTEWTQPSVQCSDVI